MKYWEAEVMYERLVANGRIDCSLSEFIEANQDSEDDTESEIFEHESFDEE